MRRSTRSHQRLLQDDDGDPLLGVANLFDAAMVFAVALLLTIVTRVGKTSSPADPDVNAHDAPTLERLLHSRELPRLRTSEREGGGQGVRLGTAYQLENGDVVYVPEGGARTSPPSTASNPTHRKESR